jgi:hypothetical protein
MYDAGSVAKIAGAITFARSIEIDWMSFVITFILYRLCGNTA